MTSLAAILGMLPLALAIGTGAELLQPLAVAVIGGLAFALILSLIVTPTMYALLKNNARTVLPDQLRQGRVGADVTINQAR